METGFLDEHGEEISAAITFAVTLLIAFGIDRLVIGRGTAAAGQFRERAISRAAQTRLRVVRRLVFVLIVLLGLALAVGRFEGAKSLATGILASSAVLGLVFGLAARHTLGNMVAGILLAVAQPIRIGDKVQIDEVLGRVDDITLSYTYIDPGDGRLMVVPNETVVSSTIFNHSTGNLSSPVIVQIWLAADADVGAARRVLDGIAEQVQVMEVSHEGVRIELRHALGTERTRVGGEEAALREHAQDALRKAGLMPSPP